MSNTANSCLLAQQNKQELGSFFNDLINLFVSFQDVSETSQMTYKKIFRQFILWTIQTGKDFNKLTGSDIIEYKHHLEKSGYQPSSQNAYLIPIRRFYEWAEREKRYPNIAKGIRGAKKDRLIGHGFLHDEESSSLLEWAKTSGTRRRRKHDGTFYDTHICEEVRTRDFAIINLMLRNGLRTVEVVRMDIADIIDAECIDTTRGKAYVVKIWGKGRKAKDQETIMSEKTYLPIREYLETYRKGAKLNDPLFSSVSPQNKGTRLTTRSISGLCKEGLQKIGKEGRRYTAHSLRTTTACALLEHGCNVFDAQQVLRHSTPATTQIYTHLKEKELRRLNAPEMALDIAF